jgi:hypothetical protein
MGMPHSSKYAPLAAYLAAQPPETVSVTLTLAEIEAIPGEALPRGAVTRQWWYNTRNKGLTPISMTARWQVAQVMMRTVNRTITFTRLPPDTIPSPRA